MAEYLITGGGAALDDALNKRNGFSYTNGDILNVGPGIYSPINFAEYIKNVEVRSTDGKEATIIDGQGLSTCFKNRYTNAGYIFNLNGFTLSNGFLSSDLSVPAYSGAAIHGAVYAYNCNIFDCSAVNLYDPWYTPFNRVAAIAGASFPHILVNCEISGCVADNFCLVRVSRMDYCDIHHNVSTAPYRGDQYTLISNCRKCKIHHNSISGIFLPAGKIVNCQIYRNQGLSSNNWLGERTRQINNIIANNVGFSLENGWGGASYWKNVVCYNNKRTNGNYATATIYGNSGRSQIWNCYFDQLSSTISWSGWNELSGNSRKNSVFIQDADFGFVDPENDDYRLRPDSMLIGKGTWDVLSGKMPTETSPAFNGTEDNEWLSANGDFTSRPYKDPPSVGAYEHIEEEPHIPNDIYPFGMVSIPTSKPSEPSNWTYKITFENVDTSNAHSYDAGLRNYSNVVYYKGPFYLSPGGDTTFTIYVDANDPDPTQFSDCTGMCMADPGTGGNFVMLWNNMVEFVNVIGGYNTDAPTAQMYDGVTGTITIEKKVS